MAADGTTEELSRRMTGSVQLEMMIEGDRNRVLCVLRAVPGVAEVSVLTADDTKSTYRITAEPDADIRHAVFESLSQNSLAILSMKQVEASLEDIFLKLTDADTPAQTETDEIPEESESEKPKHRRLFRKRGERK